MGHVPLSSYLWGPHLRILELEVLLMLGYCQFLLALGFLSLKQVLSQIPITGANIKVTHKIPRISPGIMVSVLNRASDRVRKKLQIMRNFRGRLCGKREQLCGRLCDFFKANFELDFPYLGINSHSSFV